MLDPVQYIQHAVIEFTRGRPETWHSLLDKISLRVSSYIEPDDNPDTSRDAANAVRSFLRDPRLVFTIETLEADALTALSDCLYANVSSLADTRRRRSVARVQHERSLISYSPALRQIVGTLWRLDQPFTYKQAIAIVTESVLALSGDPAVLPIRLVDEIDLQLYSVIAAHPELLRTLHWRTFEKLLADILERFGYEIELQRGSKDGGIDLFAIRRSSVLGPERYILQAKRWSSRVGIEPVRQLLFLQAHERATKACLVTTSRFTRGAWELGAEYKWQLHLRDADGLLDWVNLIRKFPS